MNLIWKNGKYVNEQTQQPFIGVVPRDLEVGDTFEDRWNPGNFYRVTAKEVAGDGTIEVQTEKI